MGIVTILDSQSETWSGEYAPEYLKWKGFYDRVPILASQIDALCEAIVWKWNIEGPDESTLTKKLHSFEGNGKQTFKQISYNIVKTALICGDSFAEIIYGGKNDLEVENIMQLPSDNIKILVRNGVIKKYKEIDGKAEWKPENILHLAWNPVGASVHGTTDIERLNDLLIAKNQIEDDCRRIYHRYVKPIHVVSLNTDDTTEILNFKTEWAKMKNISESDIFVPKDFVEIDRASIPQFSTLSPDPWTAYLQKQLVMTLRVPEVRLGEGGQANSEATAKIQDKGFKDKVRFVQEWYSETLETQLFTQMYPLKRNKIKFVFAGENPEDSFTRLMNSFKIVSDSAELDPKIKSEVLKKILIEVGLIDKQGDQ